MRTVIINYGMGNITSVSKALKAIGVDHIVSDKPDDIRNADALLLPGVGSFRAAMDNLNSSGLAVAIKENVVERGVRILGICLGMQLLATNGYEPEKCSGLGLIPGEVIPLESGLPVPHMGWNDIHIINPTYFKDVKYKDFYFVHSYHFQPENKRI